MKTLTQKLFSAEALRGAIIDVFALAFVYAVPSLSHMLSLPIYYIEPMRLILILSIVHSGRLNPYIIALTLPAFSFVTSAHPVLPKMLLISAELLLNAYIFGVLKRRTNHIFTAAVGSILASKAIYYAIKALLLDAAVINMDFFATPILVQIATTLIFGWYMARFYKFEK